MKWRTVEGELEVGNRIKCTWEWYNEYDGEVHGIEFCTRTHELRTPRPGVRHTTKMVKIPGTRNELANKEVIIYKDTDGWLIIKTVGQHRMLRGTTPRTFYQAICPEHIAAYESEQRTLEELNPEPQVPPQTQANNNPPAPGTSAWGTISSNRQREEQARAEREREAQQRLEEAERETQRERERERIRAGEHELLRQREAREAKFNIWVHHEKNEIL